MNTVPRGILNNNPLNIDYTAIAWDGQVHGPYLSTEKRFAVFQTPAAGIRAGIVNFQSYQFKDGCKTWNALIARQAPDDENDVAAYQASVAELTGFDMTAPAATRDATAMRTFVAACIVVECGEFAYDDDVWTAAINAVWKPA